MIGKLFMLARKAFDYVFEWTYDFFDTTFSFGINYYVFVRPKRDPKADENSAFRGLSRQCPKPVIVVASVLMSPFVFIGKCAKFFLGYPLGFIAGGIVALGCVVANTIKKDVPVPQKLEIKIQDSQQPMVNVKTSYQSLNNLKESAQMPVTKVSTKPTQTSLAIQQKTEALTSKQIGYLYHRKTGVPSVMAAQTVGFYSVPREDEEKKWMDIYRNNPLVHDITLRIDASRLPQQR